MTVPWVHACNTRRDCASAWLIGAGRLSAARLPDTSLRITYWEDSANASSSVTWTLRCDPARGTLARPARACARLAAGGPKLFAPLPPNAVCTEIYGGPQKARVVGVVDGKRVWSTFTRHERLPDRPLAAHLALARASGRRHELTASLVTIGGREDRPLRRRRAPPAARDRAGPQRAACASSRSTGTPRRPGLAVGRCAQKSVDFADIDAVIDVARQIRGRRRAHVCGRSSRSCRRSDRRASRTARRSARTRPTA